MVSSVDQTIKFLKKNSGLGQKNTSGYVELGSDFLLIDCRICSI